MVSSPSPTPISLGPFFFFSCVVLLVFLGFLQMPAFLQCEEGVRKETFVSLFRIEKVWGGHSLEPGLGWGVIKDEGEIPKVGQRGAPQGQQPSPT